MHVIFRGLQRFEPGTDSYSTHPQIVIPPNQHQLRDQITAAVVGIEPVLPGGV